MITKALREMYEDKRYVFSTLVVAFLVFSFMTLVTNLPLLWSSFWNNSILSTITLALKMLQGITSSTAPLEIGMRAVLTLLIGVSASLIYYKGSIMSMEASGLGTLFVVLSSGCSACGMGVLSLVGIAGGLAVLPFGGLELWIAGALLLIYSIYRTSKSIVDGSCPVRT